MEQIFIDKFFVPATSLAEFAQRMNINRNYIREQPGFVRDDVYERTDENGNFFFVTIAVWQNEAAIQKAKTEVQAEYQRTGFDMPSMLKRLNIEIERGIYQEHIS
jgi:heme-degrading monooxygenase HmoA